MPYNVLLIPLIGGYYILSNFVFFRYKYQRLSSQRLILNSALVGIIVGFVSIFIRLSFEKLLPKQFEYLSSFLSTISFQDQRYLWTMIIGLLLVIILTHLLNLVIGKISRLKYLPINIAITNYGSELEQMCRDSIVDGFALQVTLKNEKVYVGFVSEAPIPSKTNYLLFIPLYSGFRDPRTKILELTTSYGPVIDSLIQDELTDKLSIMTIVIKQDEILTMSPHDPDVFSRFSSGA